MKIMNMKRNILLLLSLALMTLFVSCTNNKDDSNISEKPFDIAYTKWEGTYHFTLNNPESALVSVVFDFKTPTEVTFSYTIKEGSIDPEDLYLLDTQKFTYTYTKPTLKILSQDKLVKTIYNVDEKAGIMSIVGQETLDDNGKWIPGEDNDKTIFRLQK